MKIKQLRAFDAFMTHRSVTKAANALRISQPMVSRLLNDFEQTAGFPLFERKRNQIVPTQEAEAFHSTVTRSLTALSELESEARAIGNKQKGSLIVAAQPIYTETFLLDVIARFKADHPDVGVKVIDVGVENLMQMIDTHTCDIGIGITLDTTTYRATLVPLGVCTARCMLPADHPLTSSDVISLDALADQAFVDLSLGSPLRTRVDYMMQQSGTQRRTVAEARTLSTVHGLVARAVGLAIADPLTMLMPSDGRVAYRPLAPSITWEMTIVHRGDRPMSSVERDFVDVVRSEIDVLKSEGVMS